MRPSRALSTRLAASCRMLSSVYCITTTSESEFSVHAGLLGGDDDTCHVACGVGAYGAGQCRLALRPNRLSCWMEEHHRCTGGEAQHQFASHRVFPNENLFLFP